MTSCSRKKYKQLVQMRSRQFTITSSLADQAFEKAASIGILNLSVQLVRRLALRNEVGRSVVLNNSSNDLALTGVERLEIHHHDQVLRGRVSRVLWDQLGVYSAAHRTGTEWLFLPKGFASFVRRCPVRLATYVHDAIQEFYASRYPSSRPSYERRYFQKGFEASLRHSDIVFTNSDFTRQEIVRYAARYDINLPPIVVAGIGFEHVTQQICQKHDTVIVLASKARHKRTDLAAEYFARWQAKSRFAGKVIWVGSVPDGITLPSFANWRHFDRLNEVEFRALVGSARALVYFSEYEGFGMPPVEAILAGTCPVYSLIPATIEVMRGCGKGFKNESYESFSAALAEAILVADTEINDWQEALRVHSWSMVTNRVVEGLSSGGRR